MLTFADPEVIRLAREEFIPVTGDDWYQRRRQDDEGAFFRKVAGQGPRKGEGGSTQQGIYVLTAGGKLLAYRNHRDPAVMRGVLKQALRDFKNLPEDQRRAGAVEVGEVGKVDNTYHREPPRGGVVLNAYTRILDRKDGSYCVGTCKTKGGDKAARDHVWLTEAEWKSLIPANPRKGQTVEVSKVIVYRIARYHLCDNTRGEPPAWRKDQVRAAKIQLTVESVDEGKVKLRLDGSVLLSTHADPSRADRGFDVRLLGHLRYDTEKRSLERFDLVALGEHWGEGSFTRGARPGRTPLGVAFELTRGETAADRVAPQGARWMQGYLRAHIEP
ncbi:MAG: hypothetical protein L0Z62_04385 [Gemmataceae bacterium]|nr:hypothetical protein [Gemmataceae bacterium]